MPHTHTILPVYYTSVRVLVSILYNIMLELWLIMLIDLVSLCSLLQKASNNTMAKKNIIDQRRTLENAAIKNAVTRKRTHKT